MKSLVIGHINYINVIPVDVEIINPEYKNYKVLGVPAVLNRELLRGCVDIGFFSSVFYLQNKNKLELAGPFCIASKKTAMSVIIGSKVRLEEMKNKMVGIYETPASATSTFLSRVILKDYFQISPVLKEKKEADAFVLIGDEALKANFRKEYPFIYDVGEYWARLTGLPAVFALLVTRPEVKKEKSNDLNIYLEDLRKTLEFSKNNLDFIVKKAREKLDLPENYLMEYYRSLHYELKNDELKSIEVMETYLKKSHEYEPEKDF